jgi:hypothetical protein
MPDPLRLTRAVRFVAEAHANHRRKGAAQEPYINHLVEVADLVACATVGADEDLVIAALCHDTIEDTGVSEAELADRFGLRVAGIVAECSDDMTLPKEERRRRRIEHAAHLSVGARIVKTADAISNLRCMAVSPPSGWPLAWRLRYVDGMRAMHDGLRGANEALDALFAAQEAQTRAALHEMGAEENEVGSPSSQMQAPGAGEPVHLVYLANTEAREFGEADRERLAGILMERFPSVTVQDGEGLFEGRRRPILIMRLRATSTEAVIALAQHLCIAFGQRFVGVEIGDHYQRIYADDTA